METQSLPLNQIIKQKNQLSKEHSLLKEEFEIKSKKILSKIEDYQFTNMEYPRFVFDRWCTSMDL